jgi:hypothetical protein
MAASDSAKYYVVSIVYAIEHGERTNVCGNRSRHRPRPTYYHQFHDSLSLIPWPPRSDHDSSGRWIRDAKVRKFRGAHGSWRLHLGREQRHWSSVIIIQYLAGFELCRGSVSELSDVPHYFPLWVVEESRYIQREFRSSRGTVIAPPIDNHTVSSRTASTSHAGRRNVGIGAIELG